MIRPRIVPAVAGLALLVVLTAACAKDPADGGPGGQPGCDTSERTTDTGLVIQDVSCGDGEEAVAGKLVTVHYTGTLEDGTKFDSSRDRDQPFPFELGSGGVIPGWEQGVPGMKVGGVRKLVIPPELGYGDQAAGSIPPNSTLNFEIELLEVADATA